MEARTTKIITAVVARLKSRRLPRKALKPFLNNELIIDLMNRVSLANRSHQTLLATSVLKEDDELCELAGYHQFNVHRGEPESVIDRLIGLAKKTNADALFRVTGDNPFTDPYLMDLMADLLIEHRLDYIRVNNVPIGIAPELYTTEYLIRLRQNMDDPDKSEYLAWYVLGDNEGRKGCIEITSDIHDDLNLYGLTVDYEEDYNRCIKLMRKIGKNEITEISLKDLISHLHYLEKLDENTEIKLPDKKRLKYREYLEIVKNVDYSIRKEVNI